jgi:pyridoxal phosphate enzyme (YggS family)
MNTLAENIQLVNETIQQACARVGRNPATVTLIAVSKTKPASLLLEAVQAGITHFGENRLEEAEIKIPQVLAQTAQKPTWHMIGHIQSRKAKAIPAWFDVVHSVDSVKLATKLAETAQTENKTLPILLEINVSGEETKEGMNGVAWAQNQDVRETLWQQVQAIHALKGIHIRGLMTMAPFYDQPEETRPVFVRLRQLRDALQNELGITLPELSMGMTNDYPIAIEEGATMVRVGRAIFGER